MINKKIIVVYLLALLPFFSLSVDSLSWVYAQDSSGDHSSITLPMVISESLYDIDGDGETEKIEILLEKGRRYNDEEIWCGNGKKWEGYFSIQIRKGETILSKQSLNSFWATEKLEFWTPEFSLIFKDYNMDGQIDFNLGQYAGCNGNLYKLLTIQANGTVVLLPVKDKNYGFSVSNPPDNPNSTESIHIDRGVVKFSYYDQSRGMVSASYKWDGKQFVIVEEKVE